MIIAVLVVVSCTFFSVAQEPTYYAQYGQDKFLNEYFFRNKRNGIFVDIGASDGINHSNTYFFEKELGWQGICIEPRRDQFELLTKNRRAICLSQPIGKEGTRNFILITGYAAPLSGFEDTYNTRHIQRINAEIAQYGGMIYRISLSCVPLQPILEHFGMEYIDYLSIDTEGSELEILQTINFNKLFIDIIDVENNYHDQAIEEFLINKGYAFVTRIQCDEIYRKKR